MANNRVWEAYPASYRARELQILASWIASGESGAVVGLVGCGRSNLLGFLCNRPDVLAHYLPPAMGKVHLMPIDLFDLPATDLSNLYRAILHAFYGLRANFSAEIAQGIAALYLENRAIQDPFLTQKALYDLITLFQEQQIQIVFVLNRFDRFCEIATPAMINTLRSLRDQFKNVLSYIVGMQQEAVYLPDPTTLGDMYWLLDSHVCWMGAMSEADARYMLGKVLRTAPNPPTAAESTAMLTLSGGFPSLLKAVGQWWLATDGQWPPVIEWGAALLNEHSMQYRLDRIWHGLTQEEKLALSEVQQGEFTATSPRLLEQRSVLARLAMKGLCGRNDAGWRINGELLNAYVARIEGRVHGKIWLDEAARTIYQGQVALNEMSGLQYEILRFLIKNPRIHHTRDDIIDNAWPEEEQRAGITPNALQVHIAAIRRKIEPNPTAPRYLTTWHGRPGGYQFFPEGKPE